MYCILGHERHDHARFHNQQLQARYYLKVLRDLSQVPGLRLETVKDQAQIPLLRHKFLRL